MSDNASCIIFSCISEKGPPLPLNPMRFAGTWHAYSASAMSHEKRMTAMSGQWLLRPDC